MISVICSTIRPGSETKASVKSVLRSLPETGELILHLDAEDGSASTWDPKISDNRLIVLRSETRIGFSQGLNLAAGTARNQYLGRIDADDICLPWRWEYQISAIAEKDVHFGSMLHYYTDGLIPFILPHYPVALSPQEFLVIAESTNPGFHPAALIRRAAFEKLGGYRDVMSEDYDLWLRALADGMSLSRGLRPVTVYRHHSEQATAATDWKVRLARDPDVRTGQNSVTEILDSQNISRRQVLDSLGARYPMARREFRALF